MPLPRPCRSLLAAALLLATASALPPGMPANVTGTYGKDFDGMWAACLLAHAEQQKPETDSHLPPGHVSPLTARRQADVQERGVERGAFLRNLGLPPPARGACVGHKHRSPVCSPHLLTAASHPFATARVCRRPPQVQCHRTPPCIRWSWLTTEKCKR